MQDYTSQPKVHRSLPWDDLSGKAEAAARNTDGICYELGLLFQDAQREAQDQWLLWNKALEEKATE